MTQCSISARKLSHGFYDFQNSGAKPVHLQLLQVVNCGHKLQPFWQVRDWPPDVRRLGQDTELGYRSTKPFKGGHTSVE